MKLVSAHITNFRCVEDSTEFTLDQVTCLVGKNEAGKTALLKALYGLKPWDTEDSQFDKERDYPRRYLADYEERHSDAEALILRTVWKLEADDTAALVEVLGPAAEKIEDVLVTRRYEETTRWQVKIDEAAVIAHLLATSGLHAEEKDALKGQKTTGGLRKAVEALGADASERHTAFLEILNKHFSREDARDAAVTILYRRMPSFVYFSQYDRMQGQVSLEEIIRKKNENKPRPLNRDDRVFLAFCDLVGTPVEEIANLTKFEAMVAKFGAASIKITRELFTFWSQNRHLKVHFRLDAGRPDDPAPFNSGNILRTRIFNTHHEMEISFDDRSTGFVWFFSFLVLFSQIKKIHGHNAILLLDEPALSLHAKAQSDLLRYIKERLAPNYQVIYTTHSPFLVPADNILSVRTVEDVVIERQGELADVRGTKVGDRVLSRDRDTVFPLQGALGYELTQTLFVGKHTLLVEGPSDLLYLKVVSDELKRRKRTFLDPRWVISPTGGASKVAAFVTLFGANELNIAALLDYAKGDKKAIEDLRKSDLLKNGRVLTYEAYAAQPEADVEDVIGAKNYVELVNRTYNVSGSDMMQVPAALPTRIVKAAETHFRTVPVSIPEFDHYAPSRYFCENQAAVLAALPEVDAMLDRFEAIFKDLNPMITA
jgi:predicted ATP-dependent endonuclease of OLD family